MLQTQEITKGMKVIRKTATSKPIVGIVQNTYEPMYSRRPILKATIEWQDSTLYINGRTTTTSSINVNDLIEATDENIADAIARSKKLTPIMKAALAFWREQYGDSYVGIYDASDPLMNDRKKQRAYEHAFDKLRNLGYLEPSPENKQRPGAFWTYRLAKKED